MRLQKDLSFSIMDTKFSQSIFKSEEDLLRKDMKTEVDIYSRPTFDDVIVISSSEDDEDDSNSVIHILDSSDDVKSTLSEPPDDVKCQLSEVADVEDDDDLPDLFVMNSNRIVNSDSSLNVNLKASMCSKETEMSFDTRNNFSHVALKRSLLNETLSGPPVKFLKRESVNLDERKEVKVKENFGNFDRLRQNIFKSLLMGGIKGRRNWCSLNFAPCYEMHSKEEKSYSTRVQSRGLYQTMFEDEMLQRFVLRPILQRAVSRNQFLCSSTVDLLLQFLFGSEDKMEAPTLSDLHLGLSILYKQLNFHPPCKPGMRPIYLKMCRDWFGQLLDRAYDVLEDKFPEREMVEEPTNQFVVECEAFFDLSDVVRRKASEKKECFLNRSKAEKILHLSALIKFFLNVFQSNALVWYKKHWSSRICAFRKDISPIMSDIIWSSSDFGCVNQPVQKLFHIYSKTWIDSHSLHEHFSSLISILAAILHRYEKCLYPAMGPLTREYARRLYMEIKNSSNIESNLSSLHPHWLKFHVISFLLDVEEPSNFYKAKERISQLLAAKDRGRPVEQSFNVETISYEAIKAMMGMMQLISNCNSFQCIDDVMLDEDLWFSKMMDREFISGEVNMIRATLNLPQIKKRKWIFDGFEDNAYC